MEQMMHQGTGLPRLILMSRRAVGSKVNLIHASIFFKIAKDVCVGYWGLMLMIPSLEAPAVAMKKQLLL